MPGEQEGPTDMLVGALLALMAFLLAVTMGMASDRFDARRGIVLAEANAIGKAYLQADYLPEPAAAADEGAAAGVPAPAHRAGDRAQLPGEPRSAPRDLHAEMWALVRGGRHAPATARTSCPRFGDSLTELVSLNETRIMAGLYARVPETVLWLLLVGSALSLGMVGYSAGLKGQRSVLSAVVLVVALGVVLALVIDLDRPQDGLINVSQQPLLDVQRWIGLPTEG